VNSGAQSSAPVAFRASSTCGGTTLSETSRPWGSSSTVFMRETSEGGSDNVTLPPPETGPKKPSASKGRGLSRYQKRSSGGRSAAAPRQRSIDWSLVSTWRA
jgi:hypothetical protein